MEEKDLLDIIKERIKAESRWGDKAKACKNASISPTTYEKAILKERFDDLTDGEEKVLSAFISILDERAEVKREKIKMLC